MINFDEIKVGMNYTTAKKMLEGFIDDDVTSSSIDWIIAPLSEKMYGVYPILQLTSRDDIVVEISIIPNWEEYVKQGMTLGDKNDAMKIWNDCIEYMESKFGKPNKEKENKKTWLFPNDVKFKVEFEKRVGYTIHIVIK